MLKKLFLAVIAILSGVVSLCTIISFSTVPSSAISETFWFKVFTVFIVNICIGSISFAWLLAELSTDEIYKKSLEQIKKLPNTFSQVKLKNWEDSPLAEFIPEESITCTAKIDDNGMIIYNIQVNIEASTADYVSFVEQFEI